MGECQNNGLFELLCKPRIELNIAALKAIDINVNYDLAWNSVQTCRQYLRII